MWRSLSGSVILRLVSADIGGILNKLTKVNISISSLAYIDDLTVELDVIRGDYKRLCTLLEGSGTKIALVKRKGLYWKCKNLLRRPVLTVGIAVYLFFVMAVPSRVLFVQVEGNRSVSDRQILEAAESCGIVFGANRRQVRSERIKNSLLEKIPQLQWVGVNTRGCVAVISVRERQESSVDNKMVKGNIIASQDAIIQQITVLRGTQLCRIGQAVKAGQMLVSGYKDYGISLRFTGADAEIYGYTNRSLEAVTLTIGQQRKEITRREQKFSVIIGKKQINFYKDSGILHTSCVKMYKKTYLTLPGGYVLPLALVRQEILYYDTSASTGSDFSFLESASREYLKGQMIAGTILKEAISLEEDDYICRISGKYECIEMIGCSTNEELGNP